MNDLPESTGRSAHDGGPPPGATIGPYVVEASLGRGGHARVLVVRDTRDGRTHALKLLHHVRNDDTIRSRFRREFRALSRLVHPNVLRVEEWGIHDGRPWFTMELVEGQDLRDALRDWATLPPDARFARIQHTLVQVTRALAYVHERGLVHRDVSPGNIMVDHDGVVKLMDFGLVTDQATEMTTSGEIVGTIAHIAPEQLRGETVDARADLYALGTVLYQMLTGRKPFSAHTVTGWVERHLHERPRPPREWEPLVPEALERVCLRLLEKRPEDRFASAMHLLAVLGDNDPVPDPDRWPPRSIGRTTTKAWLRQALDEIGLGHRGGALLLTGASGSGKTRILDMTDVGARRRGLPVARGRCRQHDRPFGPFFPIYEALRGSSPPDVLVAAFEHGEDAPQERYPVIAAFRELVVAAAPCVLLVDQVERADAASTELLEYLVRNCLELAEVPVVFVLGCEVDTPDAMPAILRSLSVVEREHLGPLSAPEVEELVLSVVVESEAAQALARRLYAETGGDPAYVADMLRGMAAHGIVRRQDQGWEVALAADTVRTCDLPMPARLREVLADRIAPLGPDAVEVGRQLAVARRPLDLDTLVAIAPFDEDRVMDALDELVDAGIVVEKRRGDKELAELSHARFRDVLLADASPADLAARHRLLGARMEGDAGHALSDVLEALAWHFEQGGVPDKAYAYLAMTGLDYLHRGHFDAALSVIDRALAMEPSARPLLEPHEADRQRAELHLARARALYHQGLWDDALADGREAIAWAARVGDANLLARAETRTGYILRNRGALDEAEPMLRDALAHAEAAGDRRLEPRPHYHLGAIAWAHGDLDTAEVHWRQALDVSRAAGVRRAEGLAHNGMGILHICRGESADARRMLETAADIFREVGMLDYLAIVRVNLIELYLSIGMLKRAMDLIDRTVAQAREVGHPHGIALGLVWHARFMLVVGRPEEARREAWEAVRLAAEIGTPDEEIAGLATLVEAMIVSGEGPQALAHVETVLDLLDDADTEGVRSQVMALLVQVLVARGELERAHAVLDQATEDPSFPHIHVRADLDLGKAARLLGRTDEAVGRLREAVEISQRCGYRFYELLAWHELSVALPPGDARDEAARRARSQGRSLAATLGRADAASFLARRWGEPR